MQPSPYSYNNPKGDSAHRNSTMNRPKRNIRRPEALSDFLTASDTDRQSPSRDNGLENLTEVDKVQEPASEEQQGKVLSPFKCGECKERYRSKVALLRHSVKHSGEKPFMCSQCGKGLSSQSALAEHLNIHSNNKPHRCEDCGKESRQLSVHLRHLITHQENPELLYPCSVCSKTFKQNEYLKKHMRKHTGEKPFICKECGKAFTCKSELNRHHHRHSSHRPYVCADCGQSFKMRHNLIKHQRAHAGTQHWKCLLCSSVFSKPKLLEAHRKVHQETVQHLQVMRPDENTLVVSAEAEDRRKLPTVHSLDLCKDNTSDVIKSSNKKFLRINDTTLPLEFILKSVGKGNVIRVKIIDKPDNPKAVSYSERKNIIELMDATSSKEEPLPKNSKNEVDVVRTEKAVADTRDGSINSEVVEVSSVLSVEASIASHCLASHYSLVNPCSEDYRGWLATFTSLARQLKPPYDTQVCRHLVSMTSALQQCLVHKPESSSESPSPSNHPDPPGYLPATDHSQYQFILDHYLILAQTLHQCFTFNCAK